MQRLLAELNLRVACGVAEMTVVSLTLLHSQPFLSSLQIDAVSLFLLYLVEMICSGLQIIYNTDEVNKTPESTKIKKNIDILHLCHFGSN